MSPIKLKDAQAIIDLAAVLSLKLAFISDWAFSTLLTPLGLLGLPQNEETERRIVNWWKVFPHIFWEVTAPA